MFNDKTLVLHFDRFTFKVTYDDLKKFILKEMNRLARETGYSIKNLSIVFKENDYNSLVACFIHKGSVPIGFKFYLNKFADTTANEIIDTCRH